MSQLGWIEAPRVSLAQWDALTRFATQAHQDGLTRLVVCGMGGSSRAPLVLATSFGATTLSVLASTDPATPPQVPRPAELARPPFPCSRKPVRSWARVSS